MFALTTAVLAQQSSSLPGIPLIPEQAGKSSEDLTTSEVQQLIHDGLSSESTLADVNIRVRTDDRAIVLIGSVNSEKQHETALRIVQSSTGGRQIVDKIKVSRSQVNNRLER